MGALEKGVTSFKPVKAKYHHDHKACKFQLAVDVVFHKAIDPAVITQSAVTLTSEIAAVYAGDAPPLADVNRQLVNLVEVYEHNGSGWVDPLRASAFVPLPCWIQDKKAVINVIGTGNDCF